MTEKRWLLKAKPEEYSVQSLKEQLDVEKIIAEMLVRRGIETYEDAKNFFRPVLSDLHDPFLMKDMDRAVSRLNKALKSNERILIYGDYDVDGTTAVAMTYNYLKLFFSAIEYYIPDRYEEGYGISYQSVDYAVENNFTLVIALDCGIKAVEKIAYAQSKGVEYIICDHHLPGKVLPAAIVLDPKREDCSYPYEELSGCGIGFKLIQAFHMDMGLPFSEIYPLLDFCAISIAADIVPVTGENRVLAYYGLKVVNENPRPGVKALLKNRKGKAEISDLVFGVAPQINAAGRIESGKQAVHLLISENDSQAEKACTLIASHNDQRKELDKTITEEALQQIQSNEEWLAAYSTVVFKEDWHKGVVGIVASRLIETYYRPTIVLTTSNGKATGSARSVKGFDIYNALEACGDILEQFGGHRYAAGMTLDINHIDDFRERFEEIVKNTLNPNALIPEITAEDILKFSDIIKIGEKSLPKFYRILKQFAPFGPENMRPVFISENVVCKHVRIVGENHLKALLFQEDRPDIEIEAVGFGLGKFLKIVENGVFHIAYTLEENHWNNKTILQINIKDIKTNLPDLSLF